MAIVTKALPSFDDLHRHVLETLCDHDRLDPGQTPFLQAVVVRFGRPCGLFFHVQGPRQVRSYALWAGDENRVLFYDGVGQRFAETRLSESPDPTSLGAVSKQQKAAA
jgi:hypothetical protein